LIGLSNHQSLQLGFTLDTPTNFCCNMKLLTTFILLVATLSAIQPAQAQTNASQYVSSIKTTGVQQAANRPNVIDAMAPYSTPNLAIDNEGETDAVSDIVANARTANYIEFGSIGFHPNATIMVSSGKTLMNSLSDYLHQNPHLMLRIHGHCNTNAPRTIITLGKSGDFFEMSPDNTLLQATAYELSALRAESARQFLIAHGISPGRIQVVGEGGNRMIYPQTSLHAHYNDRIEFLFEQMNLK
jgi:outer membrane protein OmpA-like peptidoglycan-associated protein